MRILIGVTGSVAAIKLPELYYKLKDSHPGADLRVVVTNAGMHFVKNIKTYQFDENDGLPILKREESLDRKNRPRIPLITEDHEWDWRVVGDDVMHIALKDWAELLLIAPLTANTLAKMANGLCDNLLTCICRAWRDKPLVLAPAMNTDMWNHPITQDHLSKLWSHYVSRDEERCCQVVRRFVVGPVEKELACGTTGMGAMAPVDAIVEEVRRHAK